MTNIGVTIHGNTDGTDIMRSLSDAAITESITLQGLVVEALGMFYDSLDENDERAAKLGLLCQTHEGMLDMLTYERDRRAGKLKTEVLH